MKCFLVVYLLLGGLLAVWGQGTASRIDGTVTDSSGAAVSGASVSIVKVGEAQTFTTNTDDKGYWAVPSLATGVYTVTQRMNLEFRLQALNVFNFANFELVGTGGYNVTINNSFGQTTNSFRDFNNTNDPGSRTLEFAMRFNF